MTYEEYLDEVTTLMTEKYDMTDEDAIKHVMRAQAAGFFSLHDDLPEMRTQERAEQDAQTIFEQKNKSRPHTPAKRGAQKKCTADGPRFMSPEGGRYRLIIAAWSLPSLLSWLPFFPSAILRVPS